MNTKTNLEQIKIDSVPSEETYCTCTWPDGQARTVWVESIEGNNANISWQETRKDDPGKGAILALSQTVPVVYLSILKQKPSPLLGLVREIESVWARNSWLSFTLYYIPKTYKRTDKDWGCEVRDPGSGKVYIGSGSTADGAAQKCLEQVRAQRETERRAHDMALEQHRKTRFLGSLKRQKGNA